MTGGQNVPVIAKNNADGFGRYQRLTAPVAAGSKLKQQ